MQMKANGMWYPLQPIVGNGGNPEDMGTSGDNWNYYELLLLNNNFMFNTNTPYPRINPKNFAVNGRIYDTSKTSTLLPASLQNLTINTTVDFINNIAQPAWNDVNT